MSGSNIRPAAVAGRFYPEHPADLRRQVEDLLASASAPSETAPKAIIAPHAGYVYSGSVAASAYRRFLPDRSVIRRVVLVGPSHYESFAGIALSTAEAFATPLGLVPVDIATIRELKQLPGISFRNEAHLLEHSLEVHLPFLQVVLSDFCIVPMLTGEISTADLSEVLNALWGGNETRIVISSDLSHYLEWKAAHGIDQATALAIEALEADRVGLQQACGCVPIRGLLQSARRHHLTAHTVDLRNSGDTAGPREKVVGYGAFALTE